jgi:Zn finger protein HypA/HybF involved in hydrogenase expression
MRVVLLTKHQKSRWIGPLLAEAGVQLVESNEFDTDQLGTFSGEIERTLTPKDAALTKAREACRISGNDWGLGSEGSFGGGPAAGLINWNEEILCLYQRSTGLTVYAHASGPSAVAPLDLNQPLTEQLPQWPGQHWIAKHSQGIEKGLNAQQLEAWMSQFADSTQSITIEPDLRAMYCPDRQLMLEKAAQDLAYRLQQRCPQCQSIDFVVKQHHPGLPCALCGLPTRLAKSRVKICPQCDYQESELVEPPKADPAHCHYCNP